jgi:hypothetical protein
MMQYCQTSWLATYSYGDMEHSSVLFVAAPMYLLYSLTNDPSGLDQYVICAHIQKLQH